MWGQQSLGFSFTSAISCTPGSCTHSLSLFYPHAQFHKVFVPSLPLLVPCFLSIFTLLLVSGQGSRPFFFFFFLFSHWFATPIPACFDSLNFFLFFFLQFIHLSLHFSPLFSWLTPHLLPSVLPLFLLVPFPFPTCPHFVPLLMKLKGRLLLDGKRGQVLVPVPLDKGNAGSGNKIDSYWEPHIPARMREERKMVPADNTPKSF